MGARAQVKIEETGVYLYTHWGSESIVNDVRQALSSEAGQARFNDPEYLARIIFDVMTEGAINSETGFGIGTTEHTDIDILVIVDSKSGMVMVSDRVNDTYDEYPLEDFLSQTEEQLA